MTQNHLRGERETEEICNHPTIHTQTLTEVNMHATEETVHPWVLMFSVTFQLDLPGLNKTIILKVQHYDED